MARSQCRFTGPADSLSHRFSRIRTVFSLLSDHPLALCHRPRRRPRENQSLLFPPAIRFLSLSLFLFGNKGIPFSLARLCVSICPLVSSSRLFSLGVFLANERPFAPGPLAVEDVACSFLEPLANLGISLPRLQSIHAPAFLLYYRLHKATVRDREKGERERAKAWFLDRLLPRPFDSSWTSTRWLIKG